MWDNRGKANAAIIFFAMIFAFGAGSSGAADDREPVKTVRDPHLVHFEIGRDIPPIGFTVGQIKDWPGFIGSVRNRLSDLPFGYETKFLILHLMPAIMNEDEKKVIVGELNRLLKNEEFHTRLADRMSFSKETKRLLALYRQTPTQENLQWANRGIINDMIPSAPRISAEEDKKYAKLRNIDCLTCHEAWKESKQRPETGKSEIERLEEMVAAQRITPPPVSAQTDADKVVPDDEFLRQYENLKKFIVRSGKRQNPAILEAVHPENPYTFKPLLNRLICVDCHAPAREVDKIAHAGGKSHRIKFLYGPIEETRNDAHAN